MFLCPKELSKFELLKQFFLPGQNSIKMGVVYNELLDLMPLFTTATSFDVSYMIVIPLNRL